MNPNTLLFVFALLFPFCCKAQTFETYPVQNDGEDKIIVEADVGDTDVYAYCKITSKNISTIWQVDGGLTTLSFDTSTKKAVAPDGYEYFMIDELTLKNNLSIVPAFTEDHDRVEVTCGNGVSNDTKKTFLFGVPVGPKLIEPKDVYDVFEGDNFSLDLSNVSEVFPPYLTSVWTINGTVLPSDIALMLGITFGDFDITIMAVARDFSGIEIGLTVQNKIGSDSATFTINVQFPPEAEEYFYDTIIIGKVGGTANLQAVESLSGNPYPNVTWIHPNNTIDIIELPNPRFDVIFDGVLKISPIESIDFGEYTFEAFNGFGLLTNKVMLIEAVPPGEPNVTITDVGDTYAVITWDSPTELGIPAFTDNYIFSIILNDIIIQEVTTEPNETTGVVTDLIPGTMYKVSVRAISEFFKDGGDPGFASFKTDVTSPDIDIVTVTNEDGSILVSYQLRHTGGFDQSTISVSIYCDQNSLDSDGNGDESGSGNYEDLLAEFMHECSSDCLNKEDLSGSYLFSSAAAAGSTYYCSVSVENDIDIVFFVPAPIEIVTGLPSDPIGATASEEDDLTITLRSEYSGINADSDIDYFGFHVLLQRVNDSVYVYNATSRVSGCRINCTRVINITLEQNGDYDIFITAVNEYGSSKTVQLNFTLNYNETDSGSRGITTGAIIGASVGGAIGIIIIIVVVVLVIAAVLIYLKHAKDGRKTKVKPFEKESAPSAASIPPKGTETTPL